MITCRELVELISDYLDGTLPRGARVSLRVHLFMCGACKEYHGQMVRLVEAARDVPLAELPDGFDEISDAVLRASQLARG